MLAMKNMVTNLRFLFRMIFPKPPFCVMGTGTIIDRRATIYNSSGKKGNITIGSGSHIDGELMVWANAGKIEIGNNSYIGLNTRIWSAEHIRIGDRVQFAHSCNVFDSNIHSLDPHERFQEYLCNTTKGLYKNTSWHEKEVVIGDDVWVGANSTILKGVTIGRAAIVGAGSVVTSDIPAFTIVAGNPAKIIREIEHPEN
jgi:acetyltransferase-like isoleucine patch superfamily enzyme